MIKTESEIKKLKIINIIFIILIILVIALPILFFNTQEGKVSTYENRILKGMPTDDFFQEEWKGEFTDWINDNIGFRDEFLNLRSHILFKCLNIVTSEKVYRGSDDWYFYTSDNNLKIATNDYPITEEFLEHAARVQQYISDFYKSMGMEYVLVLWASKVSVYPEYINHNLNVTQTAIDIVYNYLKEHTDVKVINQKPTVLEHKNDGQLYWKTDTHCTLLGAYYTYTAIIEGLNNYGIANLNPVDVEKTFFEKNGDLSIMLGGSGLLPTETADAVTFTQNADMDTTGGLVNQMKEIMSFQGGILYDVALFNNNDCRDDRTILVCGDSQFWLNTQIPNLLAESFSRVNLITTFWNPSSELACITDSDIIFITIAERYLYQRLTPRTDFMVHYEHTYTPNLPGKIKASKNTVSYHNICLDTVNNIKPEKNGEIVIMSDADSIKIDGWAIDADAFSCYSRIYIKLGDYYYLCNNTIKRTGVADKFENENYLYSGFSITLDASLFYDNDNSYDTLEFILVSEDGTYMYEPVEYSIKYEN